MAYKKQTWVDLETPLDAEHMNHIEDGIGSLSEENAKQLMTKPHVYIDGVIPTTKDDVLAELTYEHGPERWHAYIKIKCQGNSSMAYDKKNFTVKLYSDEARTVKLKKKMFGWPVAQNKYVLKANYVDHSHARNIVTANIWSEIVASRPDYDTLPEELRNSPNNGAVDGYPIIVFTNGNYQGVYTWNIGKDDWMWGMDEDNPNHVLMCAETNTDGLFKDTPCNFRSLWSGVNEQDWSVEVGTNSEAVMNSLNALISCVKDTDDETFRSTIGDYLDMQSAIDYYLLACADCGIDGLGKNMLLGTYDLRKWYMGAYDLDSTWLMWFNGKKFLDPERACPGSYQEMYSLLFERMSKLFKDEMYERGTELRKTVLSFANIMSRFERFCASVGKEAYEDDLIPYPEIPSADVNNIWQLRNAVRDRLEYFDAWLEAVCKSDAIFKLAAPVVMNAQAENKIGTSINLLGENRDFTVLVDMTPGEQNQEKGCDVFSSTCNTAPYYSGVRLFINDGTDRDFYRFYVKIYNEALEKTNIPHNTTQRCILAIRYEMSTWTYKLYSKIGDEVWQKNVNIYYTDYVPHTGAVMSVGATHFNKTMGSLGGIWIGTLNRFEVYERCLTDDELAAFVAGMN